MSELKPCPLCGGIMKINKSLCLTAKGKRTGYSGRCTSCGMRTQMKFTEAEAIADTNRRAEPENDDYMDGVKYAIYEIMKEVDIPGSNEICNGGDSDDEMCVQAAIRILEELIETPVNEPPICPLLSDSEVKQQCVEGPCPVILDEPLTIEQLQQMGGKPIWISGLNRYGILGRKGVDADDDGKPIYRYVIGFAYGWEWLEDVLTDGRKVYARKPREDKAE